MDFSKRSKKLNWFLLISIILRSFITDAALSTTGDVFEIKHTQNGKIGTKSPIDARELLNHAMKCQDDITCQITEVFKKDDKIVSEKVSASESSSGSNNRQNSTRLIRMFQPKDCLGIAQRSNQNDQSGAAYYLRLSNDRQIEAVCDMDINGGGWTILQRRFDGSVDFFLDWQSYKQGFGNLNEEFWLGLDNAHELMKDTNTTLRFDLWDGEVHRFSEYSEAMIASELDNYRLTYNEYKGDAGNSMTLSKNQMFTTKDRDNDVKDSDNCAIEFIGAWWYSGCHKANLNGLYGSTGYGSGLNWDTITGVYQSLSKTEIKIRRNDPNV